MKPTFSGYSTDHRSGFGLLVVEANPDQDGWALNAYGLHSKKRKMLVLIPEENALPKNPAKPWVSNRQISVDSGTSLRPRFSGCPKREANGFR